MCLIIDLASIHKVLETAKDFCSCIGKLDDMFNLGISTILLKPLAVVGGLGA